MSREYVARILRQLVAERTLVKAGTTRGTTYALAEGADSLLPAVRRRLRTQGLEEDRVWSDLRRAAPFIDRLPDNTRQIVAYAFTEMLNNAIEHSRSDTVEVATWQDDKSVWFTVKDAGIGVFRNVMQQRGLASELEAMQDLLKGKTTTAPHAHSGEGIFFTSKVADECPSGSGSSPGVGWRMCSVLMQSRRPRPHSIAVRSRSGCFRESRTCLGRRRAVS